MLSQDELNKIRENPKPEHIPALLEHVAEVEKELAELRKDKERIDWCETHLINLYDGGGAYGIEFGPISESQRLDYLPGIRAAIDSARQALARKEGV